MKTKLSVIMCALAVSAFGCGDTGTGGSGDLSDTQKTSADAAVTQSLALKGIADDPTDGTAATGGLTLGLSLFGMFPTPSSGALTVAKGGGGGGTCPADNTSPIVYDNCTIGGGTLDGTITVSGEAITYDGFSLVSSGVTLDLDGTLDFSDDMIDGTMTFSITTGGFTFGVTGVYDITLDSEGCPTGGSLAVTGDTAPYNTTVTANFGPACGDIS